MGQVGRARRRRLNPRPAITDTSITGAIASYVLVASSMSRCPREQRRGLHRDHQDTQAEGHIGFGAGASGVAKQLNRAHPVSATKKRGRASRPRRARTRRGRPTLTLSASIHPPSQYRRSRCLPEVAVRVAVSALVTPCARATPRTFSHEIGADEMRAIGTQIGRQRRHICGSTDPNVVDATPRRATPCGNRDVSYSGFNSYSRTCGSTDLDAAVLVLPLLDREPRTHHESKARSTPSVTTSAPAAGSCIATHPGATDAPAGPAARSTLGQRPSSPGRPDRWPPGRLCEKPRLS